MNASTSQFSFGIAAKTQKFFKPLANYRAGLAGLIGMIAFFGVAANGYSRPAGGGTTFGGVSTSGTFDNATLEPDAAAYYTGAGTADITWGNPAPGSGPNEFSFAGNTQSPIVTGQTFVLGTLFYHNGSVYDGSAIDAVDLDITANTTAPNNTFSGAFNIQIVATINQGINPVADADYIYFTDHPEFGSFRVFEGAGTTVQILGYLGSVDLAGFGAVGDPSAGFLDHSITAVPDSASTLTLLGLAILGLVFIRVEMLRTGGQPIVCR